ncbi:hypothetical protein D3C71_1334660 [compost metagenome]
MIRSFNPWNLKEYSKWYHYIWLMPILTFCLVYVKINNKVYELYLKIKKEG